MHDLLQESLNALLRMRRNSKEKELEALLAGENDSCSCYIEASLILNLPFFCEFSHIWCYFVHCEIQASKNVQ